MISAVKRIFEKLSISGPKARIYLRHLSQACRCYIEV